MPTHFVVKGANNLSVASPPPSNVTSVKAMLKATGPDTYDFLYNPDGTWRVFPAEIQVSIPINASSVDGHAFIADDAYQVVSIREIHNVVGGSGAQVVVKKCTGTTAPASGTALHATAIDLTATINTNITPALVATTATLQLAATDKLAMDFSGTLTGLNGVLVLWLKRLPS